MSMNDATGYSEIVDPIKVTPELVTRDEVKEKIVENIKYSVYDVLLKVMSAGQACRILPDIRSAIEKGMNA